VPMPCFSIRAIRSASVKSLGASVLPSFSFREENVI